MKILNVTHGSFYAFGAYGAAIAVGIYFDRGLPAAGGFLLMVVVAMAIGLVARPGPRARPAAPGLRQGRSRRRARDLCGVSHPRGRHPPDLGHQLLCALPAARSSPETLTSARWCCRATTSVSSPSPASSPSAASLALNYTRWGRLLTVVIFDRETRGGLRHQCVARLHRSPSSSARCWARSAAR